MMVYESFRASISRPTKRYALSGAVLTVTSLYGPAGTFDALIVFELSVEMKWNAHAGQKMTGTSRFCRIEEKQTRNLAVSKKRD